MDILSQFVPKLDAYIGFVRRFIFGETNIFIETEGCILDFQISNACINLLRFLYQPFHKISKIISDHEIEILIGMHPWYIIVLSDCFEEGESYLVDHF